MFGKMGNTICKYLGNINVIATPLSTWTTLCMGMLPRQEREPILLVAVLVGDWIMSHTSWKCQRVRIGRYLSLIHDTIWQTRRVWPILCFSCQQSQLDWVTSIMLPRRGLRPSLLSASGGEGLGQLCTPYPLCLHQGHGPSHGPWQQTRRRHLALGSSGASMSAHSSPLSALHVCLSPCT